MGPLKGRPAWNEVAPPSAMTEGMQKSRDQKVGWAGAANMSSVETPQRPEQAGGMVSKQTNAAIKGANVKRSKQTEPPADPDAHMLRDGGKY